MLVLLGVAALAVLAGVVVVAVGRGGQMADFAPDYPSVELPTQRPIAGTDVALMRLPLSLWGYHVRAVDEALRRVAFALSERDSRIATLEQRIIELRGPRTSWEPERRDTGTASASGIGARERRDTSAVDTAPGDEPGPASDRPTSDRPATTGPHKTPETTSEKAPKTTPETTPVRTSEKTSEKTPEKMPETTPETTSAKEPADRDRAEKESG